MRSRHLAIPVIVLAAPCIDLFTACGLARVSSTTPPSRRRWMMSYAQPRPGRGRDRPMMGEPKAGSLAQRRRGSTSSKESKESKESNGRNTETDARTPRRRRYVTMRNSTLETVCDFQRRLGAIAGWVFPRERKPEAPARASCYRSGFGRPRWRRSCPSSRVALAIPIDENGGRSGGTCRRRRWRSRAAGRCGHDGAVLRPAR